MKTGRSFAFHGFRAGDDAGYSVAAAGDMNGDGRADFLISAAQRDAHEETPSIPTKGFSGAVYLISGADLTALDAATGDGGRAGDGIIELFNVPQGTTVTTLVEQSRAPGM